MTGGPSYSGRHQNWGVLFIVKVPNRTDLTLSTHNGPLSVSKVTGTMDLETQNGSLYLYGVAGDVHASAQNGPLTVELRDPVLGFTDAPWRTLHVDHLGDHPDQVPDVVVIDRGSRNRERLEALADELGLVTAFVVEEGNAPTLDVRVRR